MTLGVMLLLWQNGVHVDDASFAGYGRGFAGCGLTSAWFRSGWGRALMAGEVVERIKGRVGIPWMTETVDRIVAGSPDVRVKGIATTMMATLEVIQRKVAAGRNMIVTRETTYPVHLSPHRNNLLFDFDENLSSEDLLLSWVVYVRQVTGCRRPRLAGIRNLTQSRSIRRRSS
jgi:hypothetical protein